MSARGRYPALLHTLNIYTGESIRGLADYAHISSTCPIPSAVGDQERLESEIFRQVSSLREWMAHPLGIAGVQIKPDNTLLVRLDDRFITRSGTVYTCSNAAARAILPVFIPDHELIGIPRLRVVSARGRDLTVSLVNSSARVTLRGAVGTRWADDIAEIERDVEHDRTPKLWTAPSADALERAVETEVAPRTSIDRNSLGWLGSGLLRRVALFHTSCSAYDLKHVLRGDIWSIELFTRRDVPMDHQTLVTRLCAPRWGLPLKIGASHCRCDSTTRRGVTCYFDLVPHDSRPGILRLEFAHTSHGPDEDIRNHLNRVGAKQNWIDRVLPAESSRRTVGTRDRGNVRVPGAMRETAAHSRMGYNPEAFKAAYAGTCRDRTHSLNAHGMDWCGPAQRDLRALLALGFCNLDNGGLVGPASWGLGTLSAYNITVSPRFEQTVLITDTPDNVVGWLLGLPGLRLEQLRGTDTFVTRHLPTGATLIVTSQPSGKVPAGTSRSWRPITIDRPLTGNEQQSLRTVPRISNDSKKLLGGIFCRIATADPDRKWAIGNWFHDPLDDRSARVDRSSTLTRKYRSLTGAGDHWELRWEPYPYADDLAACITSDRIGLHGARAATGPDHLILTLGTASLRMYGRRRQSTDPANSVDETVDSEV